jgi:predicted DCC family thiol-disulfide oxidoreductase YuxK
MSHSSNQASKDFDVEVFYDGDCPLCMREIRMLMRRDKNGRIVFSDIAASDFDPEDLGVDLDSLMRRIHGRLPDGRLIEGVEVFRRLYGAIGFGPLVLLSRLPGISQLLDLTYHLFAANRLRLTGRCTAEACSIEPADTISGAR